VCGRYTLSTDPATLATAFGLAATPTVEPRYNIAPTQPVGAVRVEGGERRFVRLRWGLIPSWAKDPSIGSRLINARAETVVEKPSFRTALRLRRCLVVADGFYEWQRRPDGGKQPYHIRLVDGRPFAFAGLWERWADPTGAPVETCTILTTAANALMATIHDRMPVILDAADYAAWLDPERRDPVAVLPLLAPYPPERMAAHPVSSRVNRPSEDVPELVNSL